MPEMGMKNKYIFLVINHGITMALPILKVQKQSYQWETVAAESPACLSLGPKLLGLLLWVPLTLSTFPVSPQDLEIKGCKHLSQGASPGPCPGVQASIQCDWLLPMP